MAVIDAYTNGGETSSVVTAVNNGGQNIKVIRQSVAIAAADSDGSKYRLAKIPGSAVVIEAYLTCSAITGGTGYTLGIYDTLDNGGAVVDADCFMTTKDCSSEILIGAKFNALTGGIFGGVTTTTAASCKTIAEVLGKTALTAKKEYDLVLTAATVGSAAGSVEITFVYTIAG